MTMRTLPLLLATGIAAGSILAASSAAQTSPRRVRELPQTQLPPYHHGAVSPAHLVVCPPVSRSAPTTCAGAIVDLDDALAL
jgi:hypothetical protein